MVACKIFKPLTPEFLESIGFYWHTDEDATPYVANEAVIVSEQEAEAYYAAAEELYGMFVEAGDYVIENNLFHEIGIPFNLVEAVKKSWESDVHWHIYGRFDLAGGIDGAPIKLLEFNADTPTALFETAILQWALLKANGMEDAGQFNNVYEGIRDNFKRLIMLEGDVEAFGKYYEGWKILFSSVRGNIEDENTTRLLQKMADDAGFHTAFAFVDEVGFSDEGIFYDEESYEYWFKLIPWETIALEEVELANLLTSIMANQKAIILNPAYTLMFQSKGMLKILWDLFEGHPLLLESAFEPLNVKQVKKPFLGREGDSVAILDEAGETLREPTAGEYADQPCIYQAYTELPKDAKDRSYQAGLFFAFEGCGIGFRRGGEILDNMSKFVSHIVEE